VQSDLLTVRTSSSDHCVLVRRAYYCLKKAVRANQGVFGLGGIQKHTKPSFSLSSLASPRSQFLGDENVIGPVCKVQSGAFPVPNVHPSRHFGWDVGFAEKGRGRLCRRDFLKVSKCRD
jgi:hypothetical protein